jgi:hypothetical protein
MRYRATRQGDVVLPDRTLAVYEGQFYELPEKIASQYDWLEATFPPRAPEPVPPSDGGDEPPPRAARRGRRS